MSAALNVRLLMVQKENWEQIPNGKEDDFLRRPSTIVPNTTANILLKHVTPRRQQQASLPDINIYAIAEKWNLTTVNTANNTTTNDVNTILSLLQQLARIDIAYNYNENRDFVYFDHIHKTGGTTISSVMQQAFGKDSILPGSYPSAEFSFQEANDALSAYDYPEKNYKAAYSHSHIRDNKPRASKLIETMGAIKPRLRLLTMIREPTALRASTHAMAMCHYNRLLKKHNEEQRSNLELEEQCGLDVNLTALADMRLDEIKTSCQQLEKNGNQKRKRPQLQRYCNELKNGQDPIPHCRSVQSLLQSTAYDTSLSNMYKKVMGRYTRHDAEKITIEQVEQYTLEDLGGLNYHNLLQSSSSTTVENKDNEDNEEQEAAAAIKAPSLDFVWFGITERMSESMCLFYYTFRLHPIKNGETPLHRVMECKPTSWWTDKDKTEVKLRDRLDYAVWRTANAIMDVRLAKMKMEIQTQLDELGDSLEDMYYVAPGCF